MNDAQQQSFADSLVSMGDSLKEAFARKGINCSDKECIATALYIVLKSAQKNSGFDVDFYRYFGG